MLAEIPTTVPLDWLSFLSLLVGVASLVLGGLAIWLSVRYKEQSDSVNAKTVVAYRSSH